MKNRKPAVILMVAAFAAFLATFNETFLNIAFTPIMQHFNISVATVQWLTTAYMLGAAIMVPISSFLFRKFRTKPLFLFTVGLLVIGSVICALAPTFYILLIGRIIQAIGTGMLVPIGMNITLSVVPKEKIGSYMGIMGAATTLGPSVSIISAGLILNIAEWPVLFWTFAGLTALLFVMGLIILGRDGRTEKPVLDAISVALISIALIGILYGVSTIFTGNIIIAVSAIIIGVIALIVFAKRQNKIKEPLVNLKPLAIKPFSLGITLNMLALMTVFAMNIIMPLFMQNALGVTAFRASLALFPAIIFACVVSPIAGKLFDKDGIKHILPIGFILIFAFVLALALTRDMNSLWLITLLYIPVIGGSALIIGPVQSFALSHLPRELNPHGVTMISTGFQIAGCVGSSIFTGVYALMMNITIVQGMEQGESLSIAYFVTLLVAVAVAIIGFIIAMIARKYEKSELRDETAEFTNINTLAAIMKKDVYTIKESDSILDAMKVITNNKVSGVPVVDNKGELAGFVSDGDIMRYLSKAHPLFINAYSFAAISSEENDFDDKLRSLMKSTVKDISRKKVVTVDVKTDLEEVCKVLNERHLKKVPVLEQGKMVGIINRSNITKYAIETYLAQAK